MSDELPLAGVTWKLVEFQSSDDAIGRVRPQTPDQYTMTLGTDGRAALKLNCNRGAGPWRAEPGDGRSGSFSLGPLAVTRAFCPQPSLDAQIARDAEYIRSYIRRDDRLFLSLMADGGIYEWQAVK